jgi:PAS domain S-box-containing protein
VRILTKPKTLPDFISKTRWYIYIRWFLLLAIALPGILSLFIVNGWTAQVEHDSLLGAIAVSTNGIFYIISRLIKSTRGYKILAASLIVVDVLLVTGLIFINGGIESRSPILYTIPILFSSALFGSRAIYKTTFSIIVLYDCLIFGDYLSIFHTVGAYDPWEHGYFSYVINTIVSFSAIYLIIGVVTDFITKILAAKEQEASESLAALKYAQTIANFGSWEWDVKKDTVMWSDELFRIFGIRPGSKVPNYENYLKFIHPEDRKRVNGTVKRSLNTPRTYSFEHRVVRPDGSVRYLHGNGQPILDKNGKVVKMVGTAQDITKAKELDQARTEFVSLSSHQLRTPATAVKQYLSLLIEGYGGTLNKDQSLFLQTAYESNNRQLAIVDDLLNIAQIDSGNLKLRKSKIDLVQTLSSITAEQVIKLKDKKQSINIKTKVKNLYCQVDERRLRMALDNIIDNASKYTPDGGKVTVSLSRSENRIGIEIADNGIGIAKKDIPKIFKKFSRIEHADAAAQSGTGLGLYLAKKIIDLHGGKIKIESVLGKGTKFIITLPLKNS